MDMGMVCSTDMLVMGNEIIGMAKRFIQGIDVDAETLARDVIAAVGPGGHYLQEDHTLAHFKQQLWMPQLFDRRGYEDWEADGAKDMAQRVRERVLEIIDTHQPSPLPEKTIQALIALREEGAKELSQS
jgi:trimethylamine--corrinoid protein Co-methyltransferase